MQNKLKYEPLNGNHKILYTITCAYLNKITYDGFGESGVEPNDDNRIWMIVQIIKECLENTMSKNLSTNFIDINFLEDDATTSIINFGKSINQFISNNNIIKFVKDIVADFYEKVSTIHNIHRSSEIILKLRAIEKIYGINLVFNGIILEEYIEKMSQDSVFEVFIRIAFAKDELPDFKIIGKLFLEYLIFAQDRTLLNKQWDSTQAISKESDKDTIYNFFHQRHDNRQEDVGNAFIILGFYVRYMCREYHHIKSLLMYRLVGDLYRELLRVIVKTASDVNKDILLSAIRYSMSISGIFIYQEDIYLNYEFPQEIYSVKDFGDFGSKLQSMLNQTKIIDYEKLLIEITQNLRNLSMVAHTKIGAIGKDLNNHLCEFYSKMDFSKIESSILLLESPVLWNFDPSYNTLKKCISIFKNHVMQHQIKISFLQHMQKTNQHDDYSSGWISTIHVLLSALGADYNDERMFQFIIYIVSRKQHFIYQTALMILKTSITYGGIHQVISDDEFPKWKNHEFINIIFRILLIITKPMKYTKRGDQLNIVTDNILSEKTIPDKIQKLKLDFQLNDKMIHVQTQINDMIQKFNNISDQEFDSLKIITKEEKPQNTKKIHYLYMCMAVMIWTKKTSLDKMSKIFWNRMISLQPLQYINQEILDDKDASFISGFFGETLAHHIPNLQKLIVSPQMQELILMIMQMVNAHTSDLLKQTHNPPTLSDKSITPNTPTVTPKEDPSKITAEAAPKSYKETKIPPSSHIIQPQTTTNPSPPSSTIQAQPTTNSSPASPTIQAQPTINPSPPSPTIQSQPTTNPSPPSPNRQPQPTTNPLPPSSTIQPQPTTNSSSPSPNIQPQPITNLPPPVSPKLKPQSAPNPTPSPSSPTLHSQHTLEPLPSPIEEEEESSKSPKAEDPTTSKSLSPIVTSNTSTPTKTSGTEAITKTKTGIIPIELKVLEKLTDYIYTQLYNAVGSPLDQALICDSYKNTDFVESIIFGQYDDDIQKMNYQDIFINLYNLLSSIFLMNDEPQQKEQLGILIYKRKDGILNKAYEMYMLPLSNGSQTVHTTTEINDVYRLSFHTPNGTDIFTDDMAKYMDRTDYNMVLTNIFYTIELRKILTNENIFSDDLEWYDICLGYVNFSLIEFEKELKNDKYSDFINTSVLQYQQISKWEPAISEFDYNRKYDFSFEWWYAMAFSVICFIRNEWKGRLITVATFTTPFWKNILKIPQLYSAKGISDIFNNKNYPIQIKQIKMNNQKIEWGNVADIHENMKNLMQNHYLEQAIRGICSIVLLAVRLSD